MPNDAATQDPRRAHEPLGDLFDEPVAGAVLEPAVEPIVELEADPSLRAELLASVQDVLSELGTDEPLAPPAGAAGTVAPAPLREEVDDLDALLQDDPLPAEPVSEHPIVVPVQFFAEPTPALPVERPASRPGSPATLAGLLQRRPWLATASILAANLALLLFAWSASRSLRSHLDLVRDELAQVRAAARSRAPLPAPVDPARGASEPAHGAIAHGIERAPTAGLPSFDRLALEIARREMDAGLYASARRRLYGLLAQADRVEPERRDDVEAQAAFLVADTYHREARGGAEVAR